MADIKALKEALVGELLKQFEDGVTVVNKDGEVMTVSVDSKIMTVAAKVVKDFAEEARSDEDVVQKAEKLKTFLDRRNAMKVVKS